MTPHKCPVCSGRGVVDVSFYECNEYATGTAMYDVTCKTCHGTGIVWDQKDIGPWYPYCPNYPLGDWTCTFN